MERIEKAMELMKTGTNCCQSTAMAFSDQIGIEDEKLMKLAASFGGGMGYFGLACGALAGAGMVFGNKFATSFENDVEYKNNFYAAVKKMCEEFEKEIGSATCAGIKKLQSEGKCRTCREVVQFAIKLTEKYLSEYENVLKK